MKKLIAFLMLAVAVGFNGLGEPVSSNTVIRAVDNWIAQKAQMNCPISGRVASVRLCTAANGASFYVAKLTGGGFVVTSTDTEIDPVIAFSPAKDLDSDPRNPLWALLVNDMGSRQRSVSSKKTSGAAAGSQLKAVSVRSANSAAANRWRWLLNPEMDLGGAGSVSSGVVEPRYGTKMLSDVRVAPLTKTKWDQSKDASGKNCYNYYTPGHCLCGCAATAWAQILRYHKFPTGYVTPETYYYVKEDGIYYPEDLYYYDDYYSDYGGVNYLELKQQGGVYDWDNMPYEPGRGTTDYERQAIGKLTYDLSLVVTSTYSRDSTWAYAGDFVDVACSQWGYAHAKTFIADRYWYNGYHSDEYDDDWYHDSDFYYYDEYYNEDDFSVFELKSILIPNLDARLPVGVRIYSAYDEDLAHFVVADGYGYSAGQFSVHLNMGWSGANDAWYVLPAVTAGRDIYTGIDCLYGNVYPHGPSSGAIISGRTLDDTTSLPVPGIVVKAEDDSGNVTNVTSDANGIYAFILPEGKWNVSVENASYGDYQLNIYDSENDFDLDFEVPLYNVTFDANGGVGTTNRIHNARLGPLPTAVRTGYTLAGWYTAPNGGTQVTESTMVTGDVAYYAHWTPNRYTVVFDANGGEGYMAPMSFTYDAAQSLSLNAFTKGAAAFRGWSLKPRRRAKYTNGELVKNLAERGSVTLYAVWDGDFVVTEMGNPCSFNLEDDLQVEIDADYAAGDKVTVKLEPLPKGLKLTTTPVYEDPTAKVKVVVDYKYVLSGTPTEEVDYENAPIFARVTVTKGKEKFETLQRVALEIFTECVQELTLGDDLTGGSAIAVADNVTAIAGQPANLKLAIKDGAGFAAHTVYGTVTKPGLFKVTLSYKDGKATVKSNEYWRVTAVNPGLGADDVTWAGDQLRFDPSAMTATMLQGVKLELAVDLSGLVTVGKDAAKITFKDLPAGLAYKNGMISGTPTKVEQKAVSVTVVQNGLTVVKRFAMIVEDRQLNIVCVGAGTGKVTGAGGYGAGKKVALKAAADTKDDAKKGTVASVFAGWYRDAGCTMKMEDFDGYPDWRNPSVNYIMTTQNVTFYARFEPAAADAVEQLTVKVSGQPLTESAADYTAYSDGTRRFGIESDSLSLPKFTVSGLPSQLKFTDKYLLAPAPAMAANTIYCANDAKVPAPGTYVVTVKATNASVKKAVERRFTVVVDNLTAANALLQGQGNAATRLRNARRDKYVMSVGVAGFELPWILSSNGAAVKVTKLPDGLKYDAASGNITGIATKAGTFTPYITIGAAVSTFTVEVKALPAYVVGTFNGGEYAVDDGLDVGVSTFTITDKGKISGKITEEDGIVWTVAAASFAECDLARGEYYAELVATYKDTKARPAVTYTRTFETVISNGVTGGVLAASKPAAEDDGELEIEAGQDCWKTDYKADGEALFTDGTKKFRVYDHVEAAGLAEGQSLLLKIETTGKVTGVLTDATGTFTATTTLLPLTAPGVRPMAAEVYLVFVPNAAKKFEGLAVRAQLEL